MSAKARNFIVFLLLLNIGMTIAVLLRLSESQKSEGQVATQSLPAVGLRSLAERVVAAYNDKDAEALYSLYHREAQAQLGVKKILDQIERLHGMFGKITVFSYLNNLRLGEKGGDEYFQAHFNAQVSNPELKKAELRLHVIHDDDGVSLYGMRINAAQP